MALFTKEIESKLEKQFSFEHSLEKLTVICKVVTYWGEGVLYFISQDPVFKDFLLCMGVEDGVAEVRTVCKSDIEKVKLLHLDPNFKELPALEVFQRLSNGEDV